MNITNEMVTRGALEARSWGVVSKHGEWTNEETQQQCARDIIEAVAPLIAAQSLRDAAEAFGENQTIREGDAKEWLNLRAARIERSES